MNFYSEIISDTGSTNSSSSYNAISYDTSDEYETQQSCEITQGSGEICLTGEKEKSVKISQKQHAADTEMYVQRLTLENEKLSKDIHGLQCELANLKALYQQQLMQDNQTTDQQSAVYTDLTE